MDGYDLTDEQIDLILRALNQVELTPEEVIERDKIAEEFHCSKLPPKYHPNEDPYANYCDI